jgi:hypothetical protein
MEQKQKTADGLYNIKVNGLPSIIDGVVGHWRLTPTLHAQRAAKGDPYVLKNNGIPIEIPLEIDLRREDITECEIKNGQVHKIVVRVPYNKGMDMTLVVVSLDTITGSAVLKTLWMVNKGFRPSFIKPRKFVGVQTALAAGTQAALTLGVEVVCSGVQVLSV